MPHLTLEHIYSKVCSTAVPSLGLGEGLLRRSLSGFWAVLPAEGVWWWWWWGVSLSWGSHGSVEQRLRDLLLSQFFPEHIKALWSITFSCRLISHVHVRVCYLPKGERSQYGTCNWRFFHNDDLLGLFYWWKKPYPRCSTASKFLFPVFTVIIVLSLRANN